MIMFKSTHARTVAAKDAEIARLKYRLGVEEKRSERMAGEIATLRKGGPRGNGGKFVKRANG